MGDEAGGAKSGSWAGAAGDDALDRYGPVFDMVNEGVYQLDTEGRFVAVNDAVVELTGYSRGDLLDEHVSLVLADGHASRLQSEIERRSLDRDRGNDPVEFAVQTANGDAIPCEMELHPLSENDAFGGTIGVVRDITHRKRTERELRRRERELQQYETLVETVSDVILLIDDRSRIRSVNPAVEEVFGYEPAELIGESLTTLMPERFAEAHREGVTRYLRTGERRLDWEYTELPGVTADGTEIPLAVSFSEYEHGGEHYFTGVIRDVTKRKQRERAVRESKNQLQALIDVLPVAVFVAEADGEIVEWNEAAEEIWGGEVAESESVAEYTDYEAWWVDTGEPVEPHEWPLARALEGEEVTDPDEIRIKGFDGEYRTVLNHGMPVRDADGEVSRAVVTLVDITERKEYQRRLKASNERLEQFAYAVSHDVQEPLRMVSSYLRLLEDRYGDDLDEDGREFLEFAVDGADRMRDMVQGLLEYSRIETRGDPFEPVDLDDVLDDVLADLQLRIEETGGDITREPLPVVDGDADQLRQVLQNLLDNAIEYSGDEPPRVHVSAERDGSEYVVSVRDHGIGIDPEDADRVFEIFQRLHARDEYEGTGIGLALCERIVKRHGGDIWVESEPGEGTTFSFTVPTTDSRD